MATLTAGVPITSEVGIVQSLDQTTRQVNFMSEEKLPQRVSSVLAQAAQEEPGLQLQRTSALRRKTPTARSLLPQPIPC